MRPAARLLAGLITLAVAAIALWGVLAVTWLTWSAAATRAADSWDGREACVGTWSDAALTGGMATAGAALDVALLMVVFTLARFAATGRLRRPRRLAVAPAFAAGAVAAGVGVALLFQLDDPPAPLC